MVLPPPRLPPATDFSSAPDIRRGGIGTSGGHSFWQHYATASERAGRQLPPTLSPSAALSDQAHHRLQPLQEAVVVLRPHKRSSWHPENVQPTAPEGTENSDGDGNSVQVRRLAAENATLRVELAKKQALIAKLEQEILRLHHMIGVASREGRREPRESTTSNDSQSPPARRIQLVITPSVCPTSTRNKPPFVPKIKIPQIVSDRPSRSRIATATRGASNGRPRPATRPERVTGDISLPATLPHMVDSQEVTSTTHSMSLASAPSTEPSIHSSDFYRNPSSIQSSTLAETTPTAPSAAPDDIPPWMCLQLRRPDFIARSVARQKAIQSAGQRRRSVSQLRREAVRAVIEGRASRLDAPVIGCDTGDVQAFSERAIRDETTKRYRQTDEYQRSLRGHGEKVEAATNRLLSKIYSEIVSYRRQQQ